MKDTKGKMASNNVAKVLKLTLNQYFESTSLDGYKFFIELKGQTVQR